MFNRQNTFLSFRIFSTHKTPDSFLFLLHWFYWSPLSCTGICEKSFNWGMLTLCKVHTSQPFNCFQLYYTTTLQITALPCGSKYQQRRAETTKITLWGHDCDFLYNQWHLGELDINFSMTRVGSQKTVTYQHILADLNVRHAWIWNQCKCKDSSSAFHPPGSEWLTEANRFCSSPL